MTSQVALVVRTKLSRRDRWAGSLAIDVQLGAGLRAVVGTPRDGLLAIAPLLAGLEPVRPGEVSVFGSEPRRDPAIRARVGTTLHDPVLPAARTVGAVMRDVDAIRGTDSATRSLTQFALVDWAPRKLSGLGRAELRALELLIALSTPSPLAIVLTEPTVDVAMLDRARLQQALAGAARRGACVVVASASLDDAISLAPVVHLLERGQLADALSIDQMGTSAWPSVQALRVDVDLPRLLLGVLADDPAVTGVSWDQGALHAGLTLHGRDLAQLALAVAAAASATGAEIRSIVPAPADLGEVRARATGGAIAAYYAGYYATWQKHQAASSASSRVSSEAVT